ncbi:transketolase [Candidatus Pelagibacter ubique]|nr:transketolase [Candidatus Pelagibacter ubique]
MDKKKFIKNTLHARRNLIESLYLAGSGHPGSSLSCLDLIMYIYTKFSKFNFTLSKGHGVPALYSVLYTLGKLDKKNFFSLRSLNSTTQGHPDRSRSNFIDVGTGALGQGLSVSIGFSIANTLSKNNKKVFCILGDGELQEGQIWEGLLYLESYFQKNLYIIIDYNKFQNETTLQKTLPLKNLKKKFNSFGFDVIEFDGHNFDQINKSFLKANKKNKNSILLAHTIKGKGISFMENTGKWHAKKIEKSHYDKIINNNLIK